MHRVFAQMERRFTLPKFSLKAFDALNHGVPRKVLKEKLEAQSRVPDIPVEIRC
jgi:hypothetical protein